MSPGSRPRSGTRSTSVSRSPMPRISAPISISDRPRSTTDIVPRGVQESAQSDQEDAVVGRGGLATPIAIARQDEKLTARQLEHVTKPTELVLEQTLLERDAAAVRPEHHPVQVGAAQSGEQERTAQWAGSCEERRARGRPGVSASAPYDRIDEARVMGLTGDDRPAVVLARLDEVDLVVAAVREDPARPVLGLVQAPGVRLERQALHVAMTERPHAVRERIVARDRAVRFEPQDLAVQRAGVLRAVLRLGVAGAQIELPVGAELDATTVVLVRAGDPVDQDRLLDPHPVGVAHADEPVQRRRAGTPVRVIEVHEAVLRKVRIEREAEEPTLGV